MKRIVFVLVLAASVAALVGGSLAAAAPPPQEPVAAPQQPPAGSPLTGERFSAIDIQSPLAPDQPGTVSVRAQCDLTGTSKLSFEASGIATGPYPGTFTENGVFKIGPQQFPSPGTFPDGPVLSFRSTFSIDSPNGIVRGTKSMDLGPVGRCYDFSGIDIGLGGVGFLLNADGHFVFGDALNAEYRATIKPEGGSTFQDQGTSRTIVQEVDATGTLRDVGTTTRLVEIQFFEEFGSSSTASASATAAAPAQPTTAAPTQPTTAAQPLP
jgi:opacity protein-like surface antigen